MVIDNSQARQNKLNLPPKCGQPIDKGELAIPFDENIKP
jgi:hypothetical protein